MSSFKNLKVFKFEEILKNKNYEKDYCTCRFFNTFRKRFKNCCAISKKTNATIIALHMLDIQKL